ncbi:MAG: tetratricopeptide repeat protein [bacterium]|nr:tetratricopeptide repeat protein [bacterium]
MDKESLENGLFYFKEKNFAKALKCFENMENDKKYYYMGLTHVRLKDYDSAIRNLKIYLRKETDYQLMIQISMILGYVHVQKSEMVKARKYFEKALQLDFNNSKAYAALGYIDFQLKNYNLSIKNLKRAIELDQQNATAHNSLGYIYADINMDTDQAVMECETALQLIPDYAMYLDSLGWAYYKKNDFTNAKKYLSMALEKNPDNQDIRKHFRDVITREMSTKKEHID